MMRIGLAVGDVTARASACEKGNNMSTLQICPITPHVCWRARRKLSGSQRAIANCLDRPEAFLGTKSRKVESRISQMVAQTDLVNVQCSGGYSVPRGGYAFAA